MEFSNTNTASAAAPAIARVPQNFRNIAAVRTHADMFGCAPEYERQFINPTPSWVPKLESMVPTPIGISVKKNALVIGQRYVFCDHKYLVYRPPRRYYNGTIIATFMGYVEPETPLEKEEFGAYMKENCSIFKLADIELTQPTSEHVSLERFNTPEHGAVFYNSHDVSVYEVGVAAAAATTKEGK